MSETTQLAFEAGRLGDLPADVFLPTEPEPKPRRVKGMTLEKYCERIRLGHGIGHGRDYLPWLTLRKKNPSPDSNQVVSWMPPLQRTAHYFSRGEYHTALLLLWLGVMDLREQFPIWPIAHPHPLDGAPAALPIKHQWSRGLSLLAREANIGHGFEVGTKLPYVASIDLLATVPRSGGLALAAFSSKPISEPSATVKWRTLERLELERRYSAEISALFYVSSSALIPLLTAGQLEWWLDASTLHCAPHLIEHSRQFSEQISACPGLPINEAVKRTSLSMSLPLDDAWFLFRHCAWTQQIDIDPSAPILTTYPMRPGGRALRDTLRRTLFGESWP